jgi:hypothetical protein
MHAGHTAPRPGTAVRSHRSAGGLASGRSACRVPAPGCPRTVRQIGASGIAGSRPVPRPVIQRYEDEEHRAPVAPAAATRPPRHAAGSPSDHPVPHGRKLTTWANGPKRTPFHHAPIGRQPDRPRRVPNRTTGARPSGAHTDPGGQRPKGAEFPAMEGRHSTVHPPGRGSARELCPRADIGGRERCGFPPAIVADRPSGTGPCAVCWAQYRCSPGRTPRPLPARDPPSFSDGPWDQAVCSTGLYAGRITARGCVTTNEGHGLRPGGRA